MLGTNGKDWHEVEIFDDKKDAVDYLKYDSYDEGLIDNYLRLEVVYQWV